MTVVAIDGPAGSGKSTVAAAVADRLGLPHIDTGAYYRAATLAVLRAGVDPAEPAACAEVVDHAEIGWAQGRAWLDGEDVSAEIRGPQVTAAVSTVSGHTPVRLALVAHQRAAIGPGGAVVEGRDAGTVVVPDAEVKVWLVATPQVRATRRATQRGEHGEAAVADQLADLARRDREDADRLVPAPDALRVDTSDRPVADVVAEILRHIEARAAGQDRVS